jgi:prepilin-type N-terminal cleavage/methylation domain-containing protein
MKRYTKGFTLIELLVVIAIIGILASVVLVSLNSARSKGKDTRVLTDVQQLRVQAESAYNGTDYSATFNVATVPDGTTNGQGIVAGSVTSQLITDALNNGGVVQAMTDTSNTHYVVLGKLSTGKYFCLDSRGSSDQSTSTLPVVGTAQCN